jgi:hypothetical protein
MKYPHLGQTILQWRDSRRSEHTGQNCTGSSSTGIGSFGGRTGSLTAAFLSDQRLNQAHIPGKKQAEAQAEQAGRHPDDALDQPHALGSKGQR